MRPEIEAETSLNTLYDELYGGGADQLEVREVSKISYRITLKEKAKHKLISGKLVDQWIDGDLKGANSAKQEIQKIFEELRGAWRMEKRKKPTKR